MINGAIAPHFLREMLNVMRCSPFSFSLLTDGSNDTGLEKMNPLTVKIFDVNTGRVDSFWTCVQPRDMTQQQQCQFANVKAIKKAKTFL